MDSCRDEATGLAVSRHAPRAELTPNARRPRIAAELRGFRCRGLPSTQPPRASADNGAHDELLSLPDPHLTRSVVQVPKLDRPRLLHVGQRADVGNLRAEVRGPRVRRSRVRLRALWRERDFTL